MRKVGCGDWSSIRALWEWERVGESSHTWCTRVCRKGKPLVYRQRLGWHSLAHKDASSVILISSCAPGCIWKDLWANLLLIALKSSGGEKPGMWADILMAKGQPCLLSWCLIKQALKKLLLFLSASFGAVPDAWMCPANHLGPILPISLFTF